MFLKFRQMYISDKKTEIISVDRVFGYFYIYYHWAITVLLFFGYFLHVQLVYSHNRSYLHNWNAQ